MPFEEFDRKIKEASENYHPAYDETAWKKMNDLLDEGLPGKKDDWRRIYYFLFLLIFLTAGGYILIEKPWNANSKRVTSDANIKSKEIRAAESITSQEKIITDDKNDITKIKNNDKLKVNNDVAAVTITEIKNPNEKRKSPENAGSIVIRKSGLIPLNDNSIYNKDKNSLNFDNTKTATSKNSKNNTDLASTSKNLDLTKTNSLEHPDKNNVVQQPDKITGNTSVPSTTDVSADKTEVKQEDATETEVTDPSVKTNYKNHKRILNNVGLTISVGPDKSAVLSSQPGKTTIYYGAGIRYDFTKKISVKSGFYVTDKIYSAEGKDYKETSSYYPTYTLTSVDADCKIYEIPLAVNYNFIQRPKNNIYGSLGLSSFFMKRESYHYHYNDPMGQYRYGAWTYNNENKHYFSVLTVAAGYERKLNKVFSLSAEPYIKLPLSGIGAGKIKLNSAGLLFSVTIKPFAPKQQK